MRLIKWQSGLRFLAIVAVSFVLFSCGEGGEKTTSSVKEDSAMSDLNNYKFVHFAHNWNISYKLLKIFNFNKL